MSTVAFIGDGFLTQENAFALLNDFFGITGETEEGFPIWPSDERPTLYYIFTCTNVTGFAMVLDWSEYAELPFYALVDPAIADDSWVKEVTKDASDVLDIAMLPNMVHQRDVTFFALFREDTPPNEATKKIIVTAMEGGYEVRDLTAGAYALSQPPDAPGQPESNSGEPESTPDNDEAQNFDEPHMWGMPKDNLEPAFMTTPLLPPKGVTWEELIPYLDNMKKEIIDELSSQKQRGKPRS